MSFYTIQQIEELKLKVLPQELLDIIYHTMLLVNRRSKWNACLQFIEQLKDQLDGQLDTSFIFAYQGSYWGVWAFALNNGNLLDIHINIHLPNMFSIKFYSTIHKEMTGRFREEEANNIIANIKNMCT